VRRHAILILHGLRAKSGVGSRREPAGDRLRTTE
jgi:hypothetical protein